MHGLAKPETHMKHYLRSLLAATFLLSGVLSSQAQVTDSVKIDPNYKPVLPEYRGVVGDSAVIPQSRQKQQKNYMEGTYAYPPKPRNKWEIGINGGLFALSSDVTSRGGWGVGLQVRKAIGYAFSLQGHYFHGTTYGLNWQSNTGLKNNPALNGSLDSTVNYVDNGGKFFYNHKTVADEATVNILLTLNNIGYHHKAVDRKVNMFAGICTGMLAYRTWYDAKDASGNEYNFQTIYDSGVYTDRKKTYDA